MSLSVHFCPPLSSSVEPPAVATGVSGAPPAATTVSVAPPAATTPVSPATTFLKLRQKERQGVAKGRSVKDTKMS